MASGANALSLACSRAESHARLNWLSLFCICPWDLSVAAGPPGGPAGLLYKKTKRKLLYEQLNILYVEHTSVQERYHVKLTYSKTLNFFFRKWMFRKSALNKVAETYIDGFLSRLECEA